MRARPACALGLVVMAAPLGGCDLTMFRQPKLNPQAQAPGLPNGTEAQAPPAGAVAQGVLAAEQASAAPPPVNAALLERGHSRYDIFCKPCHGVSGAGDGTVVARGFPAPPDYASGQVRALTGPQIFGVITDGYGVMFPYGDRLAPRDRWAVVAYVRVLEAARTLGQAPVPPPAGSYGGKR